MNKINIEVKEQFAFFSELLSEEKFILNSIICLKQKANNVKWLFGQSPVKHKRLDHKIIFDVERSKRDSKYHIKLRCLSLTNVPFFRFDSDGPAHRNIGRNIPLHEQSVTTPHFNSFDEDGRCIAYKNEALKNELDAKEIVKDLNFGVSLFCMECNSMLYNGEFPLIRDAMPEFEFEMSNNIDFDNITFD